MFSSAAWNHLWQLVHRRQRVAPLTSAALDSGHPPSEDDRPLGCGWFDSSHDLQHGLQVHEADPQALSRLSLADWLSLQVTARHEADTCLDAGAGMIGHPSLH